METNKILYCLERKKNSVQFYGFGEALKLIARRDFLILDTERKLDGSSLFSCLDERPPTFSVSVQTLLFPGKWSLDVGILFVSRSTICEGNSN